mgnify:CR=1 FL=1
MKGNIDWEKAKKEFEIKRKATIKQNNNFVWNSLQHYFS